MAEDADPFWLGRALVGTGSITPDTGRLFLIGLPGLLLGHTLGLKYFDTLGEAGFRRIVLALLLVSGIGLISPLLMLG